MRIRTALLFTLIAGSLAHADVTLTAKRVDPTTVELDWTSGTPSYGVYRSTMPSGVESSGNFLALTGAMSYVDSSATGAALFYLIGENACAADADCPPTGNECLDAVCSANTCTTSPKPNGYVVATQVVGDCRINVCDGNGNVVSAAEDADEPDDHNFCTLDYCSDGTPVHTPLADGTACSDGDGDVCESGKCVPTINVLRVGDGTVALSTSSTPGVLEHRKTDGTLLGTVSLPTALSGVQQPCTFAGTAVTEGALARSVNGLYITVAAYATAPGGANVATTTASTVNRNVCRVDSSGTIDSSTRLTSAFSVGDPRGAVSNDGTSFWVSGSALATSGGVWYVPLGTAGGTQILTSPNSAQDVGIFAGQLYGDSAASPTNNIFTIGSGLPTTAGQTATGLPGLPSMTNTSPTGFAFFDLNPNVAGLDTLYLASDRGVAMDGGIQKWTFDGSTWTQVATFSTGLAAGVRGLAAARLPDGTIGLYATTAEAPTRLVRFIDDFVHNPTATALATAPARYAFRGVALAPRAP